MENFNLVNAMKVKNTINLSINGVGHTKNCFTPEIASEFFSAILEVKKNPTDENVESLYEFLSKKIRIARAEGSDFVYDPETEEIFMKGFEHTPIPQILVDTIEDYQENGFDTKAIKNFWKLLMANPDPRVRSDLFDFISVHDFSLTDEGYMWVYKAVDFMNVVSQDLASFVSNAYLKVRKDWGTSARKYVVYKELNDTEEGFELKLTKVVTFEKWDLTEKGIEEVGNLADLQANIDELIDDNSQVFTDLYSHSMEIRLGEAVHMPRSECNGDAKKECSYGLHVGSTKYVEMFGGWHSRSNNNVPVLVCLINPMHVVAVPEYDNSKMRVCEYFPVALADYDGKINIIEQSHFPYDYVAHEEAELQKLLNENEYDTRLTAMNAVSDDRDFESEYMAILESRVTDLSEMKEQD